MSISEAANLGLRLQAVGQPLGGENRFAQCRRILADAPRAIFRLPGIGHGAVLLS
jgi:hypothetical protein